MSNVRMYRKDTGLSKTYRNCMVKPKRVNGCINVKDNEYSYDGPTKSINNSRTPRHQLEPVNDWCSLQLENKLEEQWSENQGPNQETPGSKPPASCEGDFMETTKKPRNQLSKKKSHPPEDQELSYLIDTILFPELESCQPNLKKKSEKSNVTNNETNTAPRQPRSSKRFVNPTPYSIYSTLSPKKNILNAPSSPNGNESEELSEYWDNSRSSVSRRSRSEIPVVMGRGLSPPNMSVPSEYCCHGELGPSVSQIYSTEKKIYNHLRDDFNSRAYERSNPLLQSKAESEERVRNKKARKRTMNEIADKLSLDLGCKHESSFKHKGSKILPPYSKYLSNRKRIHGNQVACANNLPRNIKILENNNDCQEMYKRLIDTYDLHKYSRNFNKSHNEENSDDEEEKERRRKMADICGAQEAFRKGKFGCHNSACSKYDDIYVPSYYIPGTYSASSKYSIRKNGDKLNNFKEKIRLIDENLDKTFYSNLDNVTREKPYLPQKAAYTIKEGPYSAQTESRAFKNTNETEYGKNIVKQSLFPENKRNTLRGNLLDSTLVLTNEPATFSKFDLVAELAADRAEMARERQKTKGERKQPIEERKTTLGLKNSMKKIDIGVGSSSRSNTVTDCDCETNSLSQISPAYGWSTQDQYGTKGVKTDIPPKKVPSNKHSNATAKFEFKTNHEHKTNHPGNSRFSLKYAFGNDMDKSPQDKMSKKESPQWKLENKALDRKPSADWKNWERMSKTEKELEKQSHVRVMQQRSPVHARSLVDPRSNNLVNGRVKSISFINLNDENEFESSTQRPRDRDGKSWARSPHRRSDFTSVSERSPIRRSRHGLDSFFDPSVQSKQKQVSRVSTFQGFVFNNRSPDNQNPRQSRADSQSTRARLSSRSPNRRSRQLGESWRNQSKWSGFVEDVPKPRVSINPRTLRYSTRKGDDFKIDGTTEKKRSRSMSLSRTTGRWSELLHERPGPCQAQLNNNKSALNRVPKLSLCNNTRKRRSLEDMSLLNTSRNALDPAINSSSNKIPTHVTNSETIKNRFRPNLGKPLMRNSLSSTISLCNSRVFDEDKNSNQMHKSGGIDTFLKFKRHFTKSQPFELETEVKGYGKNKITLVDSKVAYNNAPKVSDYLYSSWLKGTAW